MEIYHRILAEFYASSRFTGQQMDAAAIVEGQCYRAICQIKAILDDERLEDAQCFQKIEEIVHTMEELGSDGGTRHDFG